MKPIRDYCQNCGNQLAACFDHEAAARAGVVINGAYPVLLTHARSGIRECPTEVRYATCYSVWGINRSLKKLEVE